MHVRCTIYYYYFLLCWNQEYVIFIPSCRVCASVCVCVLITSNKDFHLPFMHKICLLKIYKRKPPETPTKMARTIRKCRRTHVLVHTISKKNIFVDSHQFYRGITDVLSFQLDYITSLSVSVSIPCRAIAHIQNTQNKNILGYRPYTVIILWE